METNLPTRRSLIKTALLTSLLFFMSTLIFAQKVYANNQTSQIYGGCLLCSIQNPQNAVGNNENDYSTMQIPLGVFARLEQSLIFPATTKQNKIVIGIGTDQVLSLALLGGIAIETFNGSTSNNDYKIITNDLLKLEISNPSRGTIEVFVSKPYDRLKITLNSGLLNLNSVLRIYYIYHKPEACTFPPFDPLHYYSFNGNINDAANGHNMTSTTSPIFQNNMPCGQGLGTTSEIPKYNLTAGYKKENGKTPSDLALNHTISFWAKTEKKQEGSTSPKVVVEPILDRLIILPDSLRLKISSAYPSFGLFENVKFSQALSTSTSFDHYVINTKDGLILVYKNGQEIFNNAEPFYLEWGTVPTLLNLLENNVSNIITLDRAQIDEFVVYDKVLTPEEIQILYTSYNWPPSAPSDPAVNEIMKNLPTKELFTVSPNPSTGQITLDGNILLPDSHISLRNLSGKEVYHSKLSFKTFDLPAILPNGVYILNLKTTDGKEYTRKIILTR
ncbi:T9SS type A sorting domain-containing protein [Chryseobacterium jejuense]|uniref:T9SS type A sorting domain-containing protein n=1 Tax=Chryseobacterium jejuense TaxID=445960 RepID=UPI001AE5AA52|nr:T9SS type A sorting domain-containing protein [Chryseobacterium jejuense]MBP2617246.1 hypothetical protein [Chryseobacterium jejuense]